MKRPSLSENTVVWETVNPVNRFFAPMKRTRTRHMAVTKVFSPCNRSAQYPGRKDMILSTTQLFLVASGELKDVMKNDMTMIVDDSNMAVMIWNAKMRQTESCKYPGKSRYIRIASLRYERW